MTNLYVFDNLKSGGGKTVGLNYLYQILMENTNSFFILPNDEDYIDLVKRNIDSEKIIVIYNPRKFRVNIRDIIFLNKFLKKNDITKIINFTNMPLISFKGTQYLMIHKAQLLISVNNNYFKYSLKQKVKIFIDKLFLKVNFNFRVVDYIIVQTNFMKEHLFKNFNFKGEVFTIPSGYGSELSENKYINNPYEDTERIILFVPTSDGKHKNIDYIFKIAKAVLENNIDIEFHVTLEKKEEYTNIIKKEKLENILILHGKIENEKIYNYYRESDGVFLPTLLESFCLPYVEGLSQGKYIITSDKSFAREVCQEHGWYFDPYDVGSGIHTLMEYIKFYKMNKKPINNANISSWEDSYKNLSDIIDS